MERYLYVFGTLGFTLYGQIMLRYRATVHGGLVSGNRLDYLVAMFTDIGVLSGLVAAVIASICWMLAVQKLALTVAYPFMALSFVLVPVTAWLALGERVTVGQAVGAALIVLGVAVSALFQAAPVLQ